jgi:hypothetical protein
MMMMADEDIWQMADIWDCSTVLLVLYEKKETLLQSCVLWQSHPDRFRFYGKPAHVRNRYTLQSAVRRRFAFCSPPSEFVRRKIEIV